MYQQSMYPYPVYVYPQQMPMQPVYPTQPMYPQYMPVMPQQQVPVQQIQQPEPQPVKEEKKEDKKDDKNFSLDMSFFVNGSSDSTTVSAPSSDANKIKKSRNRETPSIVIGSSIGSDNALPMCQSNEPYIKSYNETNSLLRGSIAQADQLNGEIKGDINDIRASKTIKNKYTYLTNLTASSSSLIAAKIAAIREIDSNITEAHNLDIKRIKDLKMTNDKNEKNDDMKIMDLYSAFVNTPIGAYSNNQVMGPSMQDINFNHNTGVLTPIDIIASGNQQPMQTGVLSPEQMRMRMESNSNMQTVVMFDRNTGKRWFETVDKATGTPVPNVAKPDNFLLEDTMLDLHAGIARNKNIDVVWPIIPVGNNTITEY